MYLDIHALHTLPYSNTNRDGLGSPKSCFYGGTQRIRVSSQSWKRCARLVLEQQMEAPTVRTRRIAADVAETLAGAHGWSTEDARRAGRAILHAYGQKPDAKTDDTNVLLWVPAPVLDELARLAMDHRDLIGSLPLPEIDDKGKTKTLGKEAQKTLDAAISKISSAMADPATRILNSRNSVITLLGRMLANTPDHTVDGATQVAHAFTIHEGAPDYDYLTAVDDLVQQGAGHLTIGEFATGTFYRYCNINITQLADQLGDIDAALRVAEAWTTAFLTVVPQGKRNSTAPATIPDLVHLAIRNAPLSLAPAFEKPIPTGTAGYSEPGRRVLADYTDQLHQFLGDPGHWTGYAAPTTGDYPALGMRHATLSELVQAASNMLLDRYQPQTA